MIITRIAQMALLQAEEVMVAHMAATAMEIHMPALVLTGGKIKLLHQIHKHHPQIL